MNGQFVALLDNPARLVQAGKIESGLDTLSQEVQRQRDQIDVSGALAVSEQRSLNPLCTGHQSKLRCRDGRSAIVVRMHRKHDRVPF